MADGPRLEPRLERELALAESGGLAERPIPVLIEHVIPARPPGGLDRRAALEAMERRSREQQTDLVARLEELGARNIERAGVANAVSAELTPVGVRLIAAHPDVRIVRLARLEDVTA